MRIKKIIHKNINDILNKSLVLSPKIYKRQIIENSKILSCVNCFYFYPVYNNNDKKENILFSKSKCLKYGTKNIISGIIEYKFAYNIRKNEDKCGLKAKNFEEK
jgi:hypothetical protein